MNHEVLYEASTSLIGTCTHFAGTCGQLHWCLHLILMVPEVKVLQVLMLSFADAYTKFYWHFYHILLMFTPSFTGTFT